MKHKCMLITILLISLLTVSHSVSAEPNRTPQPAAQDLPSYFPPFAWDRVSIYQQFADSDRLLTDDEVRAVAATSAFICIEKQHGFKTLGGADLGTKHEVQRFKAIKSDLKCLFYFNSAFAYPFVTHSKVFRYGHVSDVYKSFLLKDPKTGELANRGNVYFFDVLNPEFRRWWADTVGKCVDESGADGLFVDQMHGFVWLRPRQKLEVASAQAELMHMAKKAVGPDKILLLNNAANIPELFEIGDAFMFEHYSPKLLTKEAIVSDWGLMKKISRAGKIAVWRIGVEVENRDIVETLTPGESPRTEYEALSKKRISFWLSAFLIGAQPYSYFQYGWGWDLQTGPLADYSEFKHPLGKPLGEYTGPDPNGWTFQREFEHASVWLDLNSREGKIEWK